ncbi:hypothetical protein QYE76_017233 [Lolium multiflorum]|uniref:Retrotransposon gag domain-containing protein n=1 Tax=Lolium multiflorum TaxID=4521 RepID=A0AAD8PH41_LOLMU|nr:hypothetical protein QYE76_017233 [Lolium multiflorum]
MLKCPNHELPGNIIIDNFYARLSFQDKTLLDTTCSGSFTSNKEEFKRDLLDRIKENAEDWENDKGKESGYADKPPFKPLPPKEGNEEKEEKKKKKEKKKGTKKKKKKKENKKKEVTAYPRVNEITLGNRKYVAPNDYCDNESEYDDLPMPFTYISDHDLNEHTTFDIGNLFGTDYESNDDSIIHVPLNDDIESSKLGDVVLEDPVFETSTFSENDDITYSGLLERDIFDLFLPEFDKPWMAPPTRSNNQVAMLQILQMMVADREAERAERQANLDVLQQIAHNNQGHGNHDHPGSKLKNFQNTNPPMFSKTEDPLDADDWLQTMENNLEVAGVKAAEKVLSTTHYLSRPARAWWTSARAMNAGQMMTWEDFKLKFNKYHVPPGLIKKMRDEFRELKQGRMSVVEYRDRFLTLSRYAPDETDTNEKRKERFLNGLHDEM